MREFLAREQIAHRFVDVRKAPVDRAGTLALVRGHVRAIASRGGKWVELQVSGASDDALLQLFLGRDGASLRAPTVSDGRVIVGGFNDAALRALCAQAP